MNENYRLPTIKWTDEERECLREKRKHWLYPELNTVIGLELLMEYATMKKISINESRWQVCIRRQLEFQISLLELARKNYENERKRMERAQWLALQMDCP